MQDIVAAALDRGDYRAAATLLQEWQKKSPKDPWLLLCVGRYQEAIRRWEAAEKTYLSLLRKATVPKLMTQARQGIQRVQAQRQQSRDEALETARSAPGSKEPGFLCLEPVPSEARTAAAQGLAKVMQIDPYMARLQLPSQGWRLYRVGSVGELQYFSRALAEAGTPAFWVKQQDATGVQVFNVEYFRSVGPTQATVICRSADGQMGTIAFAWSEVSQRVVGQLPLFESVVDVDEWKRLRRKQKTQDYADIWDLHLHDRQCMLRLCDRTYQFRQGNPLPEGEPVPDHGTSTRPLWNALLAYIRTHTTGPQQDGFAKFAEGAIELIELMPPFAHQVRLPRLRESTWDPAFHLYSGLHFLRHR